MAIIYKVLHRESGSVYIGSTRKTLQERKANHKWFFRNRPYTDRHLFYCALEKYGWDNFEWSIIDECDGEGIARETRWIGAYTDSPNYTCLNAVAPKWMWDEDARSEHAERFIKYRRIGVYDLDGKHLITCCGVEETAKMVGIKPQSVRTYLKGDKKIRIRRKYMIKCLD